MKEKKLTDCEREDRHQHQTDHEPDRERSMTLKSPWIVRGNIVAVGDDPFERDAPTTRSSEGRPELRLGAGISILLDHVLMVDEQGRITALAAADSLAPEILAAFDESPSYIHLEPHEFLCPGLIDLHLHAPQFAYTGTATDRPLMGADGWLEAYAFPAERRLQSDPARARCVAAGVVRATLRAGTTTAVYFGTLHAAPSRALVDAALAAGQRALVGKVCMDRNAPTDYRQSMEENLEETRELMEYIYERAGRRRRGGGDAAAADGDAPLPLVLPVVTPRFIPTCSPRLLSALGALAAEHDCHIQTHLSESLDEVAAARSLDAADTGDATTVGRSDAAVLDAHGLLTPRTLLAHAVHMSADDAALLRRRGAAVAHCPLSNFFFADGAFACRARLQQGLAVGLGTDVAGGYSPSMLDACRATVLASRAVQHEALRNRGGTEEEEEEEEEPPPPVPDASEHILDYRHALYLATVGGARCLGLTDRIGCLRVGAEFDAILLSVGVARNAVPVFEDDSLGDVFQKILVLGDDRNVKRVFVQGRDVTVH